MYREASAQAAALRRGASSTHAERDHARARQHVFDGLRIVGIPSTAPFHREVLDEPDFIEGRVTTRWVEQTFLPERKARLKAAAEAATAALAA